MRKVRTLKRLALLGMVASVVVLPSVQRSSALTMSPGPGPFSVGRAPAAIAVGDLDRDGTADLAVVNTASRDVSILLGDGTGSFSSAGTVSTGPDPVDVALGDIDRDGDLDLVTSGTSTNKVYVRKGDGRGGFGSQNNFNLGPTPPVAIALADLSEDGKLDIVGANEANGTVAVLRGDGRGSFDAPLSSPYDAALDPSALDVADMNGDGHLDVVATGTTSGAASILLGTGTGRLVFSALQELGGRPSSVAAADMNGDNRIDVITADRSSNAVHVSNGNARGGFDGPGVAHPVAFAPVAMSASDANLDGRTDLVVAGGERAQLTMLLGAGSGALIEASGAPWTLNGAVAALTVADLDVDALPDVILARSDLDDVIVTMNSSVRDISAAPSSIDFGSVPFGTTSSPRDVTVEGAGLPTRIAGVATDEDDYVVAADACSGATVGDGYVPCVISVTFGPTVAGPHAAVLVIDSDAGSIEIALAGAGVDTTPPETTITSQHDATTTDTTPTFAFSSSEPSSTFGCSLDGSDYLGCVSPHTTAPVSTGPHTFRVRATDAHGNTDPTPATVMFTVTTVDEAAPETTITEHPASLTNDTTPTFRFMADEPGATFVCSLNGSPASACASPHTTDVLAEGSHTFGVASVDALGNTDPTPDLFSFTVDTTSPKSSIAGPSRPTRKRARYTFSFSEDVETVRCSIDGSGYSVCKTPYNARTLRPGKHVLRVTAIDEAGNVEGTPAVKRFTIVRG